MFVSIEGPDGVGKTTIINLLKKKFPEALFIREPGTTLVGERIRDILLHCDQKLEVTSELLLFVTSFIETSQKVIKPALDQGKLVIADRWFYSTEAYQCFGPISISFKHDFLTDLLNSSPILTPDLNIILMAPWEKILEHMSDRKDLDKMESKSLGFKKRVYEYYDTTCVGKKISTDCEISETFETIVQELNPPISSKIKKLFSIFDSDYGIF